MKPILFTPKAYEQLDEATIYYEQQQQGLGRRFLTAVKTTTKNISLNSRAHPKFVKNYRKCRILKFPYGIIFREKGQHIEIIYILHLSRAQEPIKKQLM